MNFFYPVHQAQNWKSQIRNKICLSNKELARYCIYSISLTLLEREFIIFMTIASILACLLKFQRIDLAKNSCSAVILLKSLSKITFNPDVLWIHEKTLCSSNNTLEWLISIIWINKTHAVTIIFAQTCFWNWNLSNFEPS